MNRYRIAALAAALTAAAPSSALAQHDGAGDAGSVLVRLFVVFGIMLVAGKFSGELFERIGQPAVLGELIAGILLGSSVLGIIPTSPDDPLTEVITIFAEIGVVVLLFEIGLETDLKQMFRVGAGAITVAVVGVLLPMLLGIAFWLSPAVDPAFNVAGRTTTAIFIGATLTATSVGITARVLQDLRAMHSVEARVVLGAAVIDDILGLLILGVVSAMMAGEAVSALSLTRSAGLAIGFLVVAVTLGLALAPRLFTLLDRMRVRGMLLVSAFAFLLLLSAAADRAGLAMIVGAFAAGIVLSGTNQFDVITKQVKPVADIFAPVFFLSIGAQFDVALLDPTSGENLVVLALGGALFLIAVFAKLVAGWAVPWIRFNRWAVGIGMVPRGEVGLIFANLGLTAGVVTRNMFSAVLIMLMGTTFIVPPLLKWAFARGGATSGADDVTTPLPPPDTTAPPPPPEHA
jgi:Kef-type K+ transport system membrane component KefB